MGLKTKDDSYNINYFNDEDIFVTTFVVLYFKKRDWKAENKVYILMVETN